MRKALRRDGKAANAIIVIVIVALVISSSALGILMLTSKNGSSGATVASGDSIKVDYIGELSNGKVFDTSEWSVATNNVTYPKSCLFSMRGGESEYTPLQFTVGQGDVITGFDQGVIGMKVGQTETINISPSEGYGALDTTDQKTFDLNQTIPTVTTMSYSTFEQRTGQVPNVGVIGVDKMWGWNFTVLYAYPSSQTVELQYQPVQGDTYHVYGSSGAGWGWNATVETVNSSSIVIKNLLISSDAMQDYGTDSSGNVFVVNSVNNAAGTATMVTGLSGSSELQGQALTFIVTIVSIN